MSGSHWARKSVRLRRRRYPHEEKKKHGEAHCRHRGTWTFLEPEMGCSFYSWSDFHRNGFEEQNKHFFYQNIFILNLLKLMEGCQGAWKGRPYVSQVNANLTSSKRFLQPQCFREFYSKNTGKMHMGKRSGKTSEIIISPHKPSKKK